jgi:hypothetical protein
VKIESLERYSLLGELAAPARVLPMPPISSHVTPTSQITTGA